MNYENELKEIGRRAIVGWEQLMERCRQWPTIADEIVLPALKDCKENLKELEELRGLYIEKYSMYDNFNSIQFWLGAVPTGLVSRDKSGSASGIEYGATLVFSQGEDGRIATIAYPFETVLPGKKREQKRGPWLGRTYTSPGAISREQVLEVVYSFLRWAERTTISVADEVKDNEIDKEWREIVNGIVQGNYGTTPGEFLPEQTAVPKMLSVVSDNVNFVKEKVGELCDANIERQKKDALAKAEPLASRMAKRVAEKISLGLVKERDWDDAE